MSRLLVSARSPFIRLGRLFSTTDVRRVEIFDSAVDAVRDIPDGSRLLVGGEVYQ
jgi:hypothetical protein